MTKIDFSKVSVYLCGPMDYAKDAGRGWRNEIIPELVKLGMHEDLIFNPCKKPLSHLGTSLSAEQELVSKFRKKKDWKGLSGIMRQIMHVDLRLVDKADVLIVNLTDSDKTTGTIHEIVVASLAHKPIYIIDERGKEHVSGWLYGLVGHDRIFDSVKDVIKELKKVKIGKNLSKKDQKQYLIFDFSRRDDE